MIKLCGCKKEESKEGLAPHVGLCLTHYSNLIYGTAQEKKQANLFADAYYATQEEWEAIQSQLED
jgi:hypothetical protein